LKKVYVKEKTEETVDQDKLQVVTVYPSKIENLSYVIFIEK
jgi:hypothetical protein